MAELRQQKGVAARALEFTILTAARTGEAIGAAWAEIDLGARLWVIPAERMKAGREHRVPFSEPVAALLAALPRKGSRVIPRVEHGHVDVVAPDGPRRSDRARL